MVVDEGRGAEMTEPKGAKDLGVRGVVAMIISGEGKYIGILVWMDYVSRSNRGSKWSD